LPYKLPNIDHAYGDKVHILADVLALSMLARLGHPDTRQPDVNRLLERCYNVLYQGLVNDLFPRKNVEVETRMSGAVDGAAYCGQIVDPETRVILVGVARAGTLPAYQGFALLNDVCHTPGVRVDHIYMQRRTDHEGRVIGVDLGGSKFGGDVDRAVVILPDPMGATGSSMSDAIGLVKTLPGVPLEIVSVNLIVTPEFIARVHKDHPDAHIYALRLDRGLSPPEVLALPPGESQGEVGINEVQYIVPGAGGLGEIINNSYA
ncbi:MAG: uracil phosphoribosyltransferase, partial [Myxococcota bacterium]|nr:uracil phosphoribosyltransferase [Myxococcota bacterium]